MPAEIQVTVDTDVCMATGACVFTAPDVFEISEDGWAQVIGPARADDERVRQAVADCPVGALRIVES